MAQTAVINPRRYQLLRTHISRTENMVSALILLLLVLLVFWVVTTRHDYDPAFRDIEPALLAKSEVDRTLYVPPLKRLADDDASTTARAAHQVPALAPFPVAILNDGWSLASRVRRFSEDTLFEKINGEAPKFTKQGFQSLHYVVVSSGKGGEEIGIELFDQGDRGGSLGIFSDHQSSTAKIESIDGVDFFRTSIGAIGRRGQFFFRIIGDEQSETIQNKAVSIARAFAALPEDTSEKSAAMLILTEKLGVDPGAVSFQKANVFKFDYAKDFWFARSEEEARLFVHEAANAESAAALYTRLVDDFGFDYDTLENNAHHSLLLHGFLQNYLGLGVSDHWIYGIENATTRADAEDALERFTILTEMP